MKTKLTTHLRHHVVAYLALFVALSGSSYAVSRLPDNSVGQRQLAKGAVTGNAIAKKAVTSSKVKSLQADDFASGQLPDGVFKQPGTLPELGSGKTLRGNYSITGPGGGGLNIASDSISFVFTLSKAPKPHYIQQGQKPPADCPGTVSFPKAKPGHLCVYEAEATGNVTTRVIGDPVSNNASQANRFGATVAAHSSGNLLFDVDGTWAVTSP